MYKVIIVFLLICSTILANQTRNRNEEKIKNEIVAGKVIVKYKNIDTKESINNAAKIQVSSQFGLQKEIPVFESAKNSEVKQKLNLNNVFVYEVSVVTDIHKLVNQLNADPSVEYAEPVYICEAYSVPNDSLYNQQYYLKQVKAEEAWEDQFGNSSVVIAIIDSGVDWDHEDLENVIWSNEGEIPGNGIDDDGNGFIDDIRGWDFVHGVSGFAPYNAHHNEDGENPDNDPMDFAGHGTHVAGIAAAHTNNSIGVASVSSGARIMPLRIGWQANNGGIFGNSLFMAQAFIYAAENGADIANLSFGSSGQTIIDAALYAFYNGVLVVTAAGNSNSEYPSSLSGQDWVLSVASVNQNDVKSTFSNYGEQVSISAPGENILSTVVDPPNFNLGGIKYAKLSGTSMASPLVASVAGLVKAKYPDYDVIQLYSQLVETADNIDNLNSSYIGKIGKGRINAARAMEEIIVPKPKLFLNNIYVEENTGNFNGHLDPGETANLNLEFLNRWGEGTNINVNLAANEEWPIEIENNSSIITTIGSFLDNEKNKYTVSFPVQCSADAYPSVVEFTLHLTGSGIDETINFTLGISPQILFVADFTKSNGGKFDFSTLYFDEFAAKKISYDYIHTATSEITYDKLKNYNVVIWSCEMASPALTANDREVLKEYLDNGGKLFISGQDIGFELNLVEEMLDVEFYNNYLRANLIAVDANQSKINGVAGDPITDGLSSFFSQPKRFSQDQFPDRISVANGSVPIFKYSDGGVGAIRYRGDYDLVYFAFGGYEAIIEKEVRLEVLQRIMNWFYGITYEQQVLTDTENTDTELEINLKVNSDTPISQVKLFYSINNSFPYEVSYMVDKGNGNYFGYLPVMEAGSNVSYFANIQMENGYSFLTETVSFYVGQDPIPPTIELQSNLLRNSINRKGTYPDELIVRLTDNAGIDNSTALLNYWVNDKEPKSVLLTPKGDDIFGGSISFDSYLHFGDIVNYYFSVSDVSASSNQTFTDTLSYIIDSVQVVDDFELEFLDWELTGQWGRSGEAYRGNYSLSDSPNWLYENNTNTTATYKMHFDFSTYIAGELSYYLASYLEVGGDSLLLELSFDNGSTWVIIDRVSQNFIGFTKRVIDISQFTGAGFENVRLRFRLHTNDASVADGVYIDDLVISMTPDPMLSVEESEDIPADFWLSQNYPNPFNPSTTIEFSVPVRSDVKITIYNILGEVVEVLQNSNIDAGSYSLLFDAANKLSSGIYFYQIIANGTDGKNFNQVKKMLLVK